MADSRGPVHSNFGILWPGWEAAPRIDHGINQARVLSWSRWLYTPPWPLVSVVILHVGGGWNFRESCLYSTRMIFFWLSSINELMTLPLSPHPCLCPFCLICCPVSASFYPVDHAAQLPLDLGLPHTRARQVRGLKQKAVGTLFPAPSLMECGVHHGYLLGCLPAALTGLWCHHCFPLPFDTWGCPRFLLHHYSDCLHVPCWSFSLPALLLIKLS